MRPADPEWLIDIVIRKGQARVRIVAPQVRILADHPHRTQRVRTQYKRVQRSASGDRLEGTAVDADPLALLVYGHRIRSEGVKVRFRV